MSIFSALGQVQDPAAREALKEIARRLTALDGTNPSQVTPSLSTDLSLGDQRLIAVGNPTHAHDLVNLSTLRGHVQARIADLLKNLKGLASSADVGNQPP